MKLINTKVLLALAFLGFNGSAFGHSWAFTNVTNKTLLVQVILSGWYNVDSHLGVYFNVIKPGENADFSWGFGNPRVGHCLSSIRVAELSRNIMGDAMYRRAVNNDRGLFDDHATNGGQNKMLRHPLRELDIVFLTDRTWGMFDEKAQKAAGELTKSVTGTLGEAAKLATAAAATAATGGAAAPAAAVGSSLDFSAVFTSLGGVVQPFMELMRRSKCTGRHFDIVEVNDNLVLVTKEK